MIYGFIILGITNYYQPLEAKVSDKISMSYQKKKLKTDLLQIQTHR